MGSNCIENLNYVEKEKVQSVTDSLILWEASCGYYATKVQALVDLASGFEDSIQKDPSADQTISGDFKLIQDGISFSSYIAPNELSIKSKANGGFDLAVDTNGLTTIKAKGVPVQTYDENGVNMLEKLKMPIDYTSVDANDVVVNSELTALEQEVDAIQANYAKIDEENTFAETQTFAKPIENVDTAIKHNLASFWCQTSWTTSFEYRNNMPTGWTGRKIANGHYEILPEGVVVGGPTAPASNVITGAFKPSNVTVASGAFVVRGWESDGTTLTSNDISFMVAY